MEGKSIQSTKRDSKLGTTACEDEDAVEEHATKYPLIRLRASTICFANFLVFDVEKEEQDQLVRLLALEGLLLEFDPVFGQ